MPGFSEYFEDFDTKIARIEVSGAVAVIDNVKKIIIMSDELITVDYGRGQISLSGKNMMVDYLSGGRMCVKGRFYGIDFTG